MPERVPTKIADIQDKLAPVVELPGWEDVAFHARLRKVSLLALIQSGHLPNELLAIAFKIVRSQGNFNPVTQSETPEDLANFVGLLHAIAKAALVEPTYEEVGELLTDDQLTAIFVCSMQGLKGLESFRKQRAALEKVGPDGKGVRG